MDDFKVILFENKYKKSFPAYRELLTEECRHLLKSICKTYRISGEDFAMQLDSMQSVYSELNAADENFKLRNTFLKLDVVFNSTVFVNWFKFKKIDAFHIDDLDKYFDDIWFPVADDIDLFDASFRWVVSIHHEGYISVIHAH